MDRTYLSDFDAADDNRHSNTGGQTRTKWKKRRGFNRRNRKASRPTTYMGQRSNSHPRSGM